MIYYIKKYVIILVKLVVMQIHAKLVIWMNIIGIKYHQVQIDVYVLMDIMIVVIKSVKVYIFRLLIIRILECYYSCLTCDGPTI